MAISYRPMSPTSYVAFTKATEAIWKKMPVEKRLSNTLYFIVDGVDDTIGKLYLGNTLIADGNGITDIGIKNLDDVNISMINSGDVLMYDMTTQKWKNTSLASEIGNLIKVFEGATEGRDGTTGLVPQPTSLDINKYLKGDGTWANPTEKVENDLSGLTKVVNTLVGTDVGVSVSTIATAKAQEAAQAAVAKIVGNAPESFDTLKEIADWISDHPETADFTALQNKVSDIETALNGTESIPGLIPTVNTMKQDVSDLKTWKTTASETLLNFQTNISNLQSELNKLDIAVGENKDKIAELEQKMVWQELYEE